MISALSAVDARDPYSGVVSCRHTVDSGSVTSSFRCPNILRNLAILKTTMSMNLAWGTRVDYAGRNKIPNPHSNAVFSSMTRLCSGGQEHLIASVPHPKT